METFTIGFTKTTAENFFGRLKESRIERLLDVRLPARRLCLDAYKKKGAMPCRLPGPALLGGIERGISDAAAQEGGPARRGRSSKSDP